MFLSRISFLMIISLAYREALPALPPLPGQGCSRAPLTQCRNQINYGEKVVGSPTFLHINKRTRHCVEHSAGRDLSLPDIRVLSRPCTSCAGVPDLLHDGVVTYLTHPWVRSGERSGQSIARQYSDGLRSRRLIPSGNQCRVARHPCLRRAQGRAKTGPSGTLCEQT